MRATTGLRTCTARMAVSRTWNRGRVGFSCMPSPSERTVTAPRSPPAQPCAGAVLSRSGMQEKPTLPTPSLGHRPRSSPSAIGFGIGHRHRSSPSVIGLGHRLRHSASAFGFGLRLRPSASAFGFGLRLRPSASAFGFGHRLRPSASAFGFGLRPSACRKDGQGAYHRPGKTWQVGANRGLTAAAPSGLAVDFARIDALD